MAFATLSAVGARLIIDTKPVPFTLQVFFVLLAGMLLGSKLGALSQVIYIGAGVAGIPVFAAPPFAGIGYLAGPTGGYLIGFVLGAFVTGLVVEKFMTLKNRVPSLVMYTISGLAGVTALYATGMSWLAVWITAVKHNGFSNSLALAWKTGVVPFILVDTLKAAGAAIFASGARLAGARFARS
ncbi:MAG: biotin transporter BioY [Actinobacteria bacterium]|nr:biotin transporter BioY [Actinomycetota bacterium]